MVQGTNCQDDGTHVHRVFWVDRPFVAWVRGGDPVDSYSDLIAKLIFGTSAALVFAVVVYWTSWNPVDRPQEM